MQHSAAVNQDAVIRSALALKLHCFEDTGAIIAAMTTSIPESPGSGRTWDYRYCWLRDAYYVFRRLPTARDNSKSARVSSNICSTSPGALPDLNLAPLYRVDGTSDLEEADPRSLAGIRRNGPVRVGNGAAIHTQNDVFGEMVLSWCRSSSTIDSGWIAPGNREIIGRACAKGNICSRAARRGNLGISHGVEAANLFKSHVLGRSGSHGAE